MSASFKQCAVTECEKNAHRAVNGKRGYCSMHYQRVVKFGDPSVVKVIPRPALDWIQTHKHCASDECLRWPFHVGKDGYGRVHNPATRHLTTASRMMCEVAHGSPPSKNHEAAHRCGRGHDGCVNPQHLYWATRARNHADKVAHGTTNRGSRQWKATLTESDVLLIRQLLVIGDVKQGAIAKRFNVDPSVISDIKHGRKWAWLKSV